MATLDTTPPTLAVSGISPDTGVSASDGLTDVATVAVSGTIDVADAGLAIAVYDGTTLVGTTTANAGGNWSSAGVTLATGANSLTARATDVAGNTGTSAAFVATLDQTPPTLAVTGITPDTGVSATDGLTNVATVAVSGTIDAADAGLTIAVYDGTTLVGTTTADAGGNWSLRRPYAGDGREQPHGAGDRRGRQYRHLGGVRGDARYDTADARGRGDRAG